MNKRVVAPPASFQLASLSSDEITNLGHVADPGQMQTPAPVDPLFSSSGKLISDLSVELSGGRSATVEQFAQLIPQKGVQSGTSDTDKFIPSGANFRDASVDLLPHGPAPLLRTTHKTIQINDSRPNYLGACAKHFAQNENNQDFTRDDRLFGSTRYRLC